MAILGLRYLIVISGKQVVSLCELLLLLLPLICDTVNKVIEVP